MVDVLGQSGGLLDDPEGTWTHPLLRPQQPFSPYLDPSRVCENGDLLELSRRHPVKATLDPLYALLRGGALREEAIIGLVTGGPFKSRETEDFVAALLPAAAINERWVGIGLRWSPEEYESFRARSRKRESLNRLEEGLLNGNIQGLVDVSLTPGGVYVIPLGGFPSYAQGQIRDTITRMENIPRYSIGGPRLV
jgi:hypothetical protein